MCGGNRLERRELHQFRATGVHKPVKFPREPIARPRRSKVENTTRARRV
jgi:hypothetical protein